MASKRKAWTQTYPNGVKLSYLPSKDTHRIRWQDPLTGKREESTRKHEREARAEAEEQSRRQQVTMGAANRNSGHATNGTLTIETFVAEQYLGEFADARGWKETTKDLRRVVLNKYVVAEYGHLPWDAFGDDQVQAVLDSTRGLSGSYRRTVRMALGTLLECARRYGCVEGSWRPLDNVDFHTRGDVEQGVSTEFVPADKIPAPDAIEQVAVELTETFGRPELGLMVRLAAYSGLRFSEAIALRPESFDFERGTIRVTHAYKFLRDGSHRLEAPKGGKRRLTVFPDWLSTQIRARCLEVGPEALLFPNSDGGPLRHQSFYYVWDPARAAAGWPRKVGATAFQWSFHSLRHHFCTWALAKAPDGCGLEVADVAFFAGHSSVRTTMDRYVDTRQGAVERFHKAAGGAPETTEADVRRII